MSYLFTSESVSRGHPDKICDQISDAILDFFLHRNPHARVACEAMVTTNLVFLAGEVSGVDYTHAELENTIRRVVRDIGYTQETFNADDLEVRCYLNKQSSDIAAGVDEKNTQDGNGAGDQGIMFGYACDETTALMPAPLYYSHQILRQLQEDRSKYSWLRPDAKSQVTFRYDENGIPQQIESVVVSTQHSEDVSQSTIHDYVRAMVLERVIPPKLISANCEFFINPTGRFVIGGPAGDAGLTGRKIIVDTYGGSAPHGGGAFSGKDPTKVDRSAAYMARYLAKNIVASGVASKCTVQLSYAIGVAKPVSIFVNHHGTSNISNKSIVKIIEENFDLSPKGIREFLKLNRSIYEVTASFGHFGRKPRADGSFSWEKIDNIAIFS